MKRLTQQEGERCARACGLYEIEPGEWLPPKDNGHWYASEQLPLGPHFWFGRLWDRAEEVSKDDHFVLDRIQTSGAGCFYYVISDQFIESEAIAYNRHPCLALCEAIEKLIAKKE